MLKRLRSAFFALVFVVLLCGAVWWLSQTEPTWYDPPDAADEQVAVFADRVEFRLVEEMQKVRPVDDSWQIRIREEQVNAWLATRLMKWMQHDANMQWPATLGLPQVRFRQSSMSLAVPLGEETDGETGSIIVATVRPEIMDGGLQAKLTSVGMGRLRLPGSPVNRLASLVEEHLVQADDRFHELVQTVLDVLAGDELLDPIIKLADDRCVEVLDLQLEDRSFVVTARTIPDCDQLDLVRRAAPTGGAAAVAD